MSNSILISGLSYPVRNLFCIGRNYEAHARELGNETPKGDPVVFLKPTSSIVQSGGEIVISSSVGRVDYETEVVVAIGSRAHEVRVEDAWNYIAGVAVGLDMTARDLQEQAKAKALPWTRAKGLDGFAPLGNFIDREELRICGIDVNNFSFRLEINGVLKQQGKSSNMIFSVAEIVSKLSHWFTLDRGDLIYTGTPEGVGPVNDGDQLHAELGESLSVLDVRVVKK